MKVTAKRLLQRYDESKKKWLLVGEFNHESIDSIEDDTCDYRTIDKHRNVYEYKYKKAVTP